MMRINLAVSWLALIGCMMAGAAVAQGDTFTVGVPDFERLYGGFTGDTFEATTYDFGTAFTSVSSATLHMEGFTDVANSTASFLVELEGLATPEVELFIPGPPSFEIDIPLLFDANVLDGMGPITMNLNTTGPGADLSTTVQLASLTFEAIPIPEPATSTILMISLLAMGRFAGRRYDH